MARKKIKSIACDIPFPITRLSLLSQYGNCKVEFDNGDVAYVHDLFGDIEIDKFNSRGDLEKIIYGVIY